MEESLKKALFFLGIIIIFPLLIPFFFTPKKETILADVRRWTESLDWEKRAESTNLMALLLQVQEFRNLYYYRLLQGNLKDKMFVYLLRLIYKQRSDLFINSAAKIGSGLFIQHGFSTIITADMGENCWVNQQVTIGYKDKTGCPKIGNNVRIGAGAKVIGNVTIGDKVTVGANAVVVKNVPDNCVVIGVPAYIAKRNGVKVKEELV
jgi:serine O-acetyltransferase